MSNVSARSPRVLSLVLLAGLLGVVAAPAAAAPGPSAERACPNRVAPPPPVDSPELNPPGPPTTEPLPVPPSPVGGERMAECGLVVPQGAPAPPDDITAASWVVHNLETGEVIAAKAPHARQRPASLIKLLLALVVVERFEPDDEITPSVRDISTPCSCVSLAAGAPYPVAKLLHGMLMVSGNDAAHTFGTALGGQQAALRMMNDLAAHLGALDTRARSTSGLDATGMVSSAYDLSVIYNYAMEQPRITEILATQKIMFPGGGKQQAFPLRNDNDLLRSYPGFLGGKTGYTDNARHTYVGGASRGGTSLGVVLLRGKQQPIRMFEQAARLLDYGFALTKRGSRPVGTIVENDPGTGQRAAPPRTRGPDAAGTAGAAGSAKSSPDSSDTRAWIVTLIVAALAVGGLLFRRSRRG